MFACCVELVVLLICCFVVDLCGFCLLRVDFVFQDCGLCCVLVCTVLCCDLVFCCCLVGGLLCLALIVLYIFIVVLLVVCFAFNCLFLLVACFGV